MKKIHFLQKVLSLHDLQTMGLSSLFPTKTINSVIVFVIGFSNAQAILRKIPESVWDSSGV